MVKNFVCLLLLTTLLLVVVECYGRGEGKKGGYGGGGYGGRCKIRTKRQIAKIQSRINTCLLYGYKFTIEGCRSYELNLNSGGRVSKKMRRKCKKAENSMRKCGFTCSKYE